MSVKFTYTVSLLLASALLLAGCQQAANSAPVKQKLTISTPSQRQITTACPGNSSAKRALCRKARVLVGRSFPSTRMLCSGRYYQLSGQLASNGRLRSIGFAWDCNTLVPLNKLRRAVEGLSKQRLGAAAGVSDYHRATDQPSGLNKR